MLSDLGRYEAAIVALNKALTIFEKIKSPDVDLIRERLAENEKREWTKITSRAQQDQNPTQGSPVKIRFEFDYGGGAEMEQKRGLGSRGG